MSRCRRNFAIGFAALLATASPAFAVDQVVVRTPGAEEGLASILQGASLTDQAKREAEAEDGRLMPREAVAAAQSEYRQMVGALYSEGYYGGTVSVRVDGREASDLSPVNPPARISQVVIEVRPGPRFVFGQADVSPTPPETELPEGYAVGEPARLGEIQRAASAGVRGWRDAGHAKVILSDERIVADHRNARLNSDIRIDPGPRLRFGPLLVQGNKRVRTERIIEIAGLPEGEVYSPEELDDAAERLRRTGAFRAVTLRDAEQIGPGDQLAIEAVIVEEKRRRLGAGAELSSTEGLNITAFWMHRNLLGGAENLRFDLAIENIGTSAPDNGLDFLLAGALRRPATPFTDVDTLIRGELRREDEPGYLLDQILLGGGLIRRFSDQLEARAGIAYAYNFVDDAFGEREYQMLLFPTSLTWDSRDDKLDATQGLFVKTDLTPFYGIDDIESGAHLEVDARTYFGFGEDRNIVLAGRVQIGSLFGPEIADAPPDFLFFAGGGGSVRGQPYQSLGVGEIDGTIIGGRSYLALSGEVRAYVRGPLGVVAFYDAGYVGPEEFYDGSGEWISGAGLGVRYDTGFGPIRVDLATPVDGDLEEANDFEIYIGIGQAF